VPAVTAHRIVGHHRAPRPAATAAFRRSTTCTASSRAAFSAALLAHQLGRAVGSDRVMLFGHYGESYAPDIGTSTFGGDSSAAA